MIKRLTNAFRYIKNNTSIIACLSILVILISILLPSGVCNAKNSVKIGVLAYRGPDEALKMWSPTADYLTSKVPGHSFEIVPLDFRAIGPAVERGELDFVLTNTSMYVEFEALYGTTRIATLKNLRKNKAYTVFGGVIFCRNDRDDIKELTDLKGKSFMAVDETSFGGWRVAWLEMKRKGINPYKDFKKLEFGNTHDNVVYAVRDGKVAAGTVRTDTLERMAEEGLINIKTFRIINEKHAANFSFALSTDLYPEWPFAKVTHTPDTLAEKVAVVLLDMPYDSPAAKSAKIAGWTIPHNYEPVHELMKELGVGPYVDFGKVTFADVFKKYWLVLLLVAAGLFSMTAFTVIVSRLNKKLGQTLIERRSIEDKLQQQNEFMRIIIDSIPHPFYVINANDYTIQLANKALKLPDSPQKPTCYSITHKISKPCGGEEHPCTLLEVKNTGGPVVLEHIHYDNSGNGRKIEVHGYPIFDGKGNVVQIIEHSIDISERKKAEEQALKLSQAVEHIPHSVIITDAAGTIEYVNPKFTEITGYAPEEAIGKKPSILKSGQMPPEMYGELWDTITSGDVWHGEMVNKKKNGVIFWESVSISPIRNSNGTVTHFVAVKEDITDRKLLLERFKQILSEHQIILENANIGIAFLKDRKIMHINSKCEDLFGYLRHEIMGRSSEIFYPDHESYKKFGEIAYKDLSSGQAYSAERMMKHKDRGLFWCRLFGKAIEPGDLSKGTIWIIEDITEQKASEQRLKQQQRQLEELNKTLEKRVAEEVEKSLVKDRLILRQAHLADLGALAAGITHEINTPMTYIKGNLELLKMELGEAGSEANELFDSIEDGIKRVSTIVESMKHISGYSTKEKVMSNVFSTIIDAGRMVYNRAKHISPIYINGRPFAITIGKDEEVFMAPIASQSLSQVWIVILNNALDEFMKTGRPFEKRYINIQISKNYDKIRVVIGDNAGGIPEDIIDKIFDMFVSTKAITGTGLGLHIAKTIVEGHGGNIRAYNDKSGAVFEIILQT